MIVLGSDPPPAGGTLSLGEDTLAETAPAEDVATHCADQLRAWEEERDEEITENKPNHELLTSTPDG